VVHLEGYETSAMEIQGRPRRGVESDYVIKQIQRVVREKTSNELLKQTGSVGIIPINARKAPALSTPELPDT